MAETKKPAAGAATGASENGDRKWEMEKENNTKMGNIVELLQAASFAPQKQKALLRE